MSHYLSQLEGSERAQECIRNDKEMNAQLHPLFELALAPFAPPAISQAEWEAADLAYLQDQVRRDQRFRDRLIVVHELELAMFRRAGWL